MTVKKRLAHALKLGLLLQAATSGVYADRRAQAGSEHQVSSMGLEQPDSYTLATQSLARRAEFLEPPQFLFNETVADQTLHAVSSTATRDGQRYVVAYYSIDSLYDVARYELAVYDEQWSRIRTYTEPGQDNLFNAASDFNQLNLRTIPGKGNGILLFSRVESAFNTSGKIYIFACSPTSAGTPYRQQYTIEASSALHIDNFAVSLSPDQRSIQVVTSETNRQNGQSLVKLNAYIAVSEDYVEQDVSLSSGLMVAVNASNPSITHHVDNSSLIVYERADQKTIYYKRYRQSPDFTELQGETTLLTGRRTPKCLRVDDNGDCIIASLGTGALDNRVYLSRIDLQGNVLDDKAVTSHQLNVELTLGELKLQENKVLLPVTRQAQGLYQLILNIVNRITLGRVSGRDEFEIVTNVTTHAVDLVPVSTNQTDAIYIRDNHVLERSIETTNHPPVVVGTVSPVELEVNQPLNATIINPFQDSDNDELHYTLTTPSGAPLPENLTLDISDEQVWSLVSSGIAETTNTTLRLEAADNDNNRVFVDFSFRVVPAPQAVTSANPSTPSSTTQQATPVASDPQSSPQDTSLVIVLISVLSGLSVFVLIAALYKRLSAQKEAATHTSSDSSTSQVEPIYHTITEMDEPDNNYQTLSGTKTNEDSDGEVIYNTMNGAGA